MAASMLVTLMLLAVPVQTLAGNAVAHAKVTPLQKVISMLTDMLSKAEVDMKAEQVEFAKFSSWCEESNAASEKSIAAAAAAIDDLSATIAKADSDADVLAEEISTLDAQIAKAEAEVAEMTAERKKENGIYQATHTDFSESIDALGRAIQVLKAKMADVPQSAALLQVQKLARVPQHVKERLASFLQQAPEANAYEFQSGGVVDMLKKLKMQFIAELNKLEKEEMNAKANFQMTLQQMTDDIKVDTATSEKKTGEKASKLEASAEATSTKNETEKAKAADEAALSDRKAECSAKSDEVTANQKVRGEEIVAIKKAIEIMSSPAVTGAVLLQVQKKGAALAQLRSTASKAPHMALMEQVAAFLQSKGTKLGSRYLQVVAAHATEDPFVKVKQMIKDLIMKLQNEANSEADENAYCSAELGTNKVTREDLSSEVDSLTAKIESETALVESLSSDLSLLSADVAELQSAQAEATKIRGEEKASNAKTVADAKEAQTAVESAIQVLQDFYGKSEAMLQEAQKEPYTGMKSESGGVLGMLEVILSDFARLETQTSSDEDEAAYKYTKMMEETTETISVKEAEIKHKTDKRTSSEAELKSMKKELGLTQEELDKAMAYYDKLKASCVDTGLSYEERKQAREEEIQSLKEALEMLNTEELGF